MSYLVSRTAPKYCAAHLHPVRVRNTLPSRNSLPHVAELRRHLTKPSSPQATRSRRIEVLRPSYKPRSDIEELAIFQTIHCERLYFALSRISKDLANPSIAEPVRQQVNQMRAAFTEPLPSFSEYLHSLSEQHAHDLTEEQLWDLHQSYDLALHYAIENRLDQKLIQLIEKHKKQIHSQFDRPSSIMSV